MEILSSWRPEQGGAAARRRWADATADHLEPHALPGGCPNLLAAEHHDQTAHAYGPHADRLGVLKAKFDPAGMFTATPLPQRP
ncbi:hypothetical protein ABT189_09185 [Streptomyces sp900105755]|uniref:hypothetical protein n=1 Tax=Streptomyces sp. 900105755 TaxID=3154389 RepID=UPI00331652A7